MDVDLSEATNQQHFLFSTALHIHSFPVGAVKMHLTHGRCSLVILCLNWRGLRWPRLPVAVRRRQNILFPRARLDIFIHAPGALDIISPHTVTLPSGPYYSFEAYP